MKEFAHRPDGLQQLPLKAFAQETSRPTKFRMPVETKAIISGGGVVPPDVRPEPVVMAYFPTRLSI